MNTSSNLVGLVKAATAEDGHASSAITLLPFGNLIKSVADDDSFGRYVGRQTINTVGEGLGGLTGAGAVGGLAHLLSKGKATGPAAILGALFGLQAGNYGTDRLFDKLIGPKNK